MKIYIEIEVKEKGWDGKPDDDSFGRWSLLTGLIEKVVHSTIEIGQFELVKGMNIDPRELGDFKAIHMILTDGSKGWSKDATL